MKCIEALPGAVEDYCFGLFAFHVLYLFHFCTRLCSVLNHILIILPMSRFIFLKNDSWHLNPLCCGSVLNLADYAAFYCLFVNIVDS